MREVLERVVGQDAAQAICDGKHEGGRPLSSFAGIEDPHLRARAETFASEAQRLERLRDAQAAEYLGKLSGVLHGLGYRAPDQTA